MVEEYTYILRKDVWDIVSISEGKSVVISRQLCKIKHVVDGNIEKFKKRFMVRWFSQKEGVDYDDPFSPVAMYASIGVVISIASVMRWRIHQMDVKTTFLDEIIDEEEYIEKPHGFEVYGRESHVCRLKKALYRLRQAPKA
jgi:hypothetical protein